MRTLYIRVRILYREINIKTFLLQSNSITDVSRFDELSVGGNSDNWTADGSHPTIEGHQIIKEELQKVIEKYI